MINYHHSTGNNQPLIIFICSSQPSGTGTQGRLARRRVGRPGFLFRPPVIQGRDDCSCCCCLLLLCLLYIFHFVLVFSLLYLERHLFQKPSSRVEHSAGGSSIHKGLNSLSFSAIDWISFIDQVKIIIHCMGNTSWMLSIVKKSFGFHISWTLEKLRDQNQHLNNKYFFSKLDGWFGLLKLVHVFRLKSFILANLISPNQYEKHPLKKERELFQVLEIHPLI